MNTINIPSKFKITEEQFQVLVTANQDLRLERTANGELIIMPPHVETLNLMSLPKFLILNLD
jgi:Uma2 family endonuclease